MLREDVNYHTDVANSIICNSFLGEIVAMQMYNTYLVMSYCLNVNDWLRK